MLHVEVLQKGKGPPLIFLHGFLGCAQDFLPLCSHLPGKLCIGIDLPGHGQSDFDPDFKIPYPEFHLIGYSMGGRMALQRKEQNSLSLTLLSVHPGLKTKREKDQRLLHDQHWHDKLLHLPIDEFLFQWYDQPIFQSFRPDLNMRRRQNKENLAKALLHYSLAHQDFFPIEGVLIGERDEKFKKLYQEPTIIPQAAHCVHLENPQAVANILIRKLNL